MKEEATATEQSGRTYTEAFPDPEAKVDPDPDGSAKAKDPCDFREKVSFTVGSSVTSELTYSAPPTSQGITRPERSRN